MSGNIYVRVCNYGTSICSSTTTSTYVYSYDNTVYISPAAWVVPTILAVCIIVGVLSCWRRRQFCFRGSRTDVYVPVTGAVVVHDSYGNHVVQPNQPVVYAQPVYTPAPAQPYYPPQQQAHAYQQHQQPYYQPQ